ncbi:MULTISPECIES: DUF3054 domain-containing protein [unclassified Meiothermus]|uniref:DUF3054 domain-containing protein n=1 Tax=unclassified Meiothermus TaxID=370471 RepID=UPI000D7CDB8E|nr:MULTISPECIES: DUF3054 domain-containing protein [unclassified Meiothermus]PZA05829.1 DUF3054 domain-containing protein [Meiothermus sp. Pnk-1]RYM40846.1 DUF3054 domain-containing protein [Meiothermus sp. PNK-Is4]
MAEPTSFSRSQRAFGRVLARGDGACIVLFSLLGQAFHGALNGLGAALIGVLHNAVPILAVWFLLAPFVRTYAHPTWRNLLTTWILAVPAGVWLRYMALGKPFDQGFLAFLLVTLGVTLAFLLAWRGLAYLLWRR